MQKQKQKKISQNCKLLLCIWILNKKNKSKFNKRFQIYQNSFKRGANATTDLQEHRFALRLNALLFVVSSRSLSLSLHSAGKQHVVGAPSLFLSLSLFTAHQYQTCACSARSLHRSLSITHDRLSPSSRSLIVIVIVIVIKLISSAKTTTRTAATKMAKQISSMHTHTHTHHTYTHIYTHLDDTLQKYLKNSS